MDNKALHLDIAINMTESGSYIGVLYCAKGLDSCMKEKSLLRGFIVSHFKCL